jgi:serine/threonine protein kinase
VQLTQAITVQKFLGFGATADVFLAHRKVADGGVEEGVVKMFHEASVHLMGHEVACLTALRNALANEPALLASLPDATALDCPRWHAIWITPVCEGTAVFDATNCAQVLRLLFHVHSNGWVHRDIRPQNILTTSAGQLVLIDWGFAVRWRAIPVPYQGTNNFASLDILESEYADHVPHPKNDLHAVVLMVLGDSFNDSNDQPISHHVRAAGTGRKKARIWRSLLNWLNNNQLMEMADDAASTVQLDKYLKLARALKEIIRIIPNCGSEV